MKLIKIFNPFLPAFCLLITFTWVGYDSFFREKYSEEEKVVFVEGTKKIESLSKIYYHLGDKLGRNIKNEGYYYIYCLGDTSIEFDSVRSKLEALNKRIVYNFLDKNKPQQNKEILITSAFENYINQEIKIDELLKEHYQDFVLENNLSNQEINKLYFSHDSLQNKYHILFDKTSFSKKTRS